jgi:predicted nucleotidyltransferase
LSAPDILAIVRALNSSGVKYVLIGGAAMMLHGSAYVSYDTDLCYARDSDNIDRLVLALRDFKPALRVSTGETLPFIWDARTLTNGANFTLATSAGDLDILAKVTGIGDYDAITAYSAIYDVGGLEVPMLRVEGLIVSKRAAGRPKDLLAMPELELMREVEKRMDEQN